MRHEAEGSKKGCNEILVNILWPLLYMMMTSENVKIVYFSSNLMVCSCWWWCTTGAGFTTPGTGTRNLALFDKLKSGCKSYAVHTRSSQQCEDVYIFKICCPKYIGFQSQVLNIVLL